MTPKTPEDYLFKGEALAISFFSKSEGLELIEEAMRKKTMNIGFLWRADARMSQLYETASLDDLSYVLRDLAAARAILNDHPRSLGTSMESQIAAVIVYRFHNQLDKSVTAFEDAKKLNELLASYPDNLDAAHERIAWSQFSACELGTPWEWNPKFTELRKRTGSRLLTCYEGEYYFRKGKDAEAIELLRTQQGYYFADMLRFLATLDGEQFSEEREALLKGTDFIKQESQNQVTLYSVRLAYGRPQEATQGMRKFLNNGGMLPPRPYHSQWEKYYRTDGPNREEALLTTVNESRYEQGRVYFEIALKHLGEGNRREAERFFRKSNEYISPPFRELVLEHCNPRTHEKPAGLAKTIKMIK